MWHLVESNVNDSRQEANSEGNFHGLRSSIFVTSFKNSGDI